MNTVGRRLLAIAIILCSLLYIPYALYSAHTQDKIAQSAMPVRGVVMRQDEITCEDKGGKYARHVCQVAVIAEVSANPPWTGRVVLHDVSASSQRHARELAQEQLSPIKTRDALSLYAISRGGEQDYISESSLEDMKRAGDPTNNLYLLFTPLFIALGLAAFFDKLSRRW